MLLCGSLFSGVGGMDLGLEQAGFGHAFLAEIDEWSRAVLAERFPGVTIYDDVRNVPADAAGGLACLAGGFPCQDLSVAGRRAGLEGARSGLFYEFMRIADDLRPRSILIENVEGLYSSGSTKGADFGIVLDSLAELGYLATWRTLDAQHFGVPQRRRRVFLCAIADGDPAAGRIGEVLAVAESSRGDSPTSDPAWPALAATVAGGSGSRGGRVVASLSASGYTKYTDQEFVRGGQLVTGHDLPIGVNPSNTDVAGTLPSNQQGGQRTTDIAGAYVYRKSARVRSSDTPETCVDDGVANTLNRFDVGDVRTTHAVVGFSHTQGLDPQATEERTPTLRKNGSGMADSIGHSVRRLTPMECERLMGWPDGWTDVPWRNKEHSPDSRRYAACGNGVVAPVAYWIGMRLAAVLN
jgi:DNA (cytosine-5)-methyltransferase 1